jgi:serine phosphatase RsbU (regulator of sigma subunit)/anti-sigma regulatory factor (Ser/Thr protein kinase)
MTRPEYLSVAAASATTEPARQRTRATALPRVAAVWLGVGAAYYLGARLGLELSLVDRNVTPLWPPTGIALAAFVLFGRRGWPVVLIAAFAVNLPISTGVVPAAATAVGNTAAPLLAAVLLERRGFRHQLDRGRDALDLVFLGALGSMLVSALVGAGALVLSGGIPRGDALAAWAVWWTGDAMGVLVVAPFAFSLTLWRGSEPWPTARRLELVGILVGVTGASALVALTRLPVLFLLLPLLGWASWRMQLRGAAPAALITSLLATWAATHGLGQFADRGLASGMLALQGFNASVALTSFFLAALVTERASAARALEQAAAILQGRVARRTADLSAAQARLVQEIHERSLAEERLSLEEGRARREHQIAETLQRSLLPGQLPHVTGVELAARYVPAAGDVQVGGDWYDVIQLPGGRIGLAIGDVAGHGLPAASTMGQLRMALRACALRDPAPVSVLRGVSQIVEQLPAPELATLAYLLLDPDTGQAWYASAGHPPPLVLADGRTRYLEGGLAPPVGAVREDLYREVEVQLSPGSTVLLYTDGLVERRDASIQHGLDRLAVAALLQDEPDPDALCDSILGSMLEDRPNSDDIAVVVARLTLPLQGPLHLRLPARPTQLAHVRRTVRRWLRDQQVPEAAATEVLIACGEACANCVQHAYDGSAGVFDLEVRRDGDELVLVVRDEGAWRRPGEREGGWGMALMRSLMDVVEVQHGPSGTVVAMRRAVFGGEER